MKARDELDASEWSSSPIPIRCCTVGLKAPGSAQGEPCSDFSTPFVILHALPRDHCLKHCLQLIFKAACNQPRATRPGFQAVQNAEVRGI